jgi:thioredoxin
LLLEGSGKAGRNRAPGTAILFLMSNLKKFEEDTFDQDVLQASGPVLIDFYADWCGPCKMMAPVIDQIAVEYEGQMTVGKLDVDSATSIAMRYGVMSIPTLGYFRDGKLVDRMVGYPGPGGVRAFVQKNSNTSVV